METLDALARELQSQLIEYNHQASGITDKETLAKLRLEQNANMVELLRKQRRALEFMLGMEVTPEVQFAEAIIEGKGGGGLMQ